MQNEGGHGVLFIILESTEAKQCVAGSDTWHGDPELPLHKIVKTLKCWWPCRCPLRKAAGSEVAQPQDRLCVL